MKAEMERLMAQGGGSSSVSYSISGGGGAEMEAEMAKLMAQGGGSSSVSYSTSTTTRGTA